MVDVIQPAYLTREAFERVVREAYAKALRAVPPGEVGAILETIAAEARAFARHDQARDAAYKEFAQGQVLGPVVKSAFNYAWDRAKGALAKDAVSDTAKNEYEAHALFVAIPFRGGYHEVRTWASLIDNQSVFVDVPGPVRTQVGRVQNVEIKLREP